MALNEISAKDWHDKYLQDIPEDIFWSIMGKDKKKTPAKEFFINLYKMSGNDIKPDVIKAANLYDKLDGEETADFNDMVANNEIPDATTAVSTLNNIINDRIKYNQDIKQHGKECVEIYQDDEWLVLCPLTAEASRKYCNNGNKWCTASSSYLYHFPRYTYMSDEQECCLLSFLNKINPQKSIQMQVGKGGWIEEACTYTDVSIMDSEFGHCYFIYNEQTGNFTDDFWDFIKREHLNENMFPPVEIINKLVDMTATASSTSRRWTKRQVVNLVVQALKEMAKSDSDVSELEEFYYKNISIELVYKSNKMFLARTFCEKDMFILGDGDFNVVKVFEFDYEDYKIILNSIDIWIKNFDESYNTSTYVDSLLEVPIFYTLDGNIYFYNVNAKTIRTLYSDVVENEYENTDVALGFLYGCQPCLIFDTNNDTTYTDFYGRKIFLTRTDEFDLSEFPFLKGCKLVTKFIVTTSKLLAVPQIEFFDAEGKKEIVTDLPSHPTSDGIFHFEVNGQFFLCDLSSKQVLMVSNTRPNSYNSTYVRYVDVYFYKYPHSIQINVKNRKDKGIRVEKTVIKSEEIDKWLRPENKPQAFEVLNSMKDVLNGIYIPGPVGKVDIYKEIYDYLSGKTTDKYMPF